jgi:hypothetical protein
MNPHDMSSGRTSKAKPGPPSHRGHITDARGRKVTQLDPVTMHLLHQHDVIETGVLRAIAHEKGVSITGWERASLAFGVAGLLLVIGFFIESIVTKDFGTAPLARSSSLVYFSIVPWVVWVGLKSSRFGKITEVMLKHLRCPHCGYSLKSLLADEEDGATVCPECGCAWNLTSGPGGDGEL